MDKINSSPDNRKNMLGKFKEFDDIYNYPKNKTLKYDYYQYKKWLKFSKMNVG